jgi:dCMP deaminase
MKKKYIDAYMDVAERFAQLSSAVRLQVGAIAVKDDRIVSIGYNGTPHGWDNDCETRIYMENDRANWQGVDNLSEQYPYLDEAGKSYRLTSKPEVLHAESNCISKLARSPESGNGAAMFVTHAPCIDCAKLIYQSGISAVYYKHRYRDTAGIKFLEKCGIPVTELA